MNKSVYEEITVNRSESFHWAINYDLFEFLQKHIHKLDTAYHFLNGYLPDQKQESLDYFYKVIRTHEKEMFENKSSNMRARRVYENILFQRGLDPKVSLDIGITNRRSFKDVFDFTSWLVNMLPYILEEETIPEDILKTSYWLKKSGTSDIGYIPTGLFRELIDWLSAIQREDGITIAGQEVNNLEDTNSPVIFGQEPDGKSYAWPYWVGKKLNEMGYESI
jgi:hypothetical protein